MLLKRVMVVVVSVTGLSGSASVASTAKPSDEFAHVLAGLARASDRYLEQALSFTAEETTRVLRYPLNSGRPDSYRSSVNIYFYQKTASGGLIDRRVERAEMKRVQKQLKRSEDATHVVADLYDPMNDPRIPFYIVRPYGWIVVFSRGVQARYEYEFERLADYKTGPALRIRFRPREGTFEKEDWFGSAVVDLESLHILSAEGMQLEDYQAEQRMKAAFESDEDLPLETAARTFVVKQIATKFSLVKDGLRLPTRVHSKIYRYIIRETANSRKIREHLETEVIQKFENYKFYAVKTGRAVQVDSKR